jgi:hypothetical protein
MYTDHCTHDQTRQFEGNSCLPQKQFTQNFQQFEGAKEQQQQNPSTHSFFTPVVLTTLLCHLHHHHDYYIFQLGSALNTDQKAIPGNSLYAQIHL